ncbi:AAA family ATPase [Sorangium sp. So ce131]
MDAAVYVDDASHVQDPNPVSAPICPFPGLEFFDEDRANLFFGRDAEINEALQRLGDTGDTHRRWLQIDGPSGAGKSSLARAGLVPRVQQGGWIAGTLQRFRTAVFRPGPQPVRALATALRCALKDRLPPGSCSADALALELGTSRSALARLLREHAGEEGFLLVVDQLEEALTLSAPEARVHLDRLLAQALLDPGGPLYLVTTIRSDFEAGLRVLPELSALLNAHASRYHLRPISAPGLRAAIAGPAQHVGLRWERGLPERLLDDAAATDASLPLVAHVLQALWTKREGDLLTHAAYDALGGLGGALTRSVDPVIDRLGAEGRERARRLLLRLVKIGRGAEDTRQTASRAEVLEAAGGDEDAERLLLRLSGGREPGAADGAEASVRLVVVSRREGEDRVDLVHEALLKRWATLRDWIEASRKALERRDDLEAAAKVWEAAGGHEDGLPGGAQLAYLREAEAPGPRARRFLEMATALEARRVAEREAARLRLEQERNEAERQRERAERRLADAIELADEVHLAIERDLKPIAGTAAIRRKLLARTAALLDRAGESPEALHSRMVNHRERGELALTHDGDLTLARREFEAALSIMSRLVELDAHNAQYKRELPAAYGKLGEVAHIGGDLRRARGYYEKSLALLKALSRAEPATARPQWDDLATVHAKLGVLEQEAGHLQAARGYFDDALRQLEALTEAEPQNVGAWRDLSRVFHMLGDVAHSEGDLASARGHHEKALGLAEALSKRDPQNANLRRDLSVSCNKAGDMALARGDLTLARDHYQRSFEIIRSLLEAYPHSLEWQFDLVHVHIRLASWASQSNEATAFRHHRDAGTSVLNRLERSAPVQGIAAFYELRTALDLLRI